MKHVSSLPFQSSPTPTRRHCPDGRPGAGKSPGMRSCWGGLCSRTGHEAQLPFPPQGHGHPTARSTP